MAMVSHQIVVQLLGSTALIGILPEAVHCEADHEAERQNGTGHGPYRAVGWWKDRFHVVARVRRITVRRGGSQNTVETGKLRSAERCVERTFTIHIHLAPFTTDKT
uniref:Putative secreted protein n=1 Tax=Anopheles darlingi TaxID=43151 RepID=A0A2M4D655_ANODA